MCWRCTARLNTSGLLAAPIVPWQSPKRVVFHDAQAVCREEKSAGGGPTRTVVRRIRSRFEVAPAEPAGITGRCTSYCTSAMKALEENARRLETGADDYGVKGEIGRRCARPV